MTDNDKAAERAYFKALNAIFHTNDKSAFAVACRECATIADDPKLKSYYNQLASDYEREETSGNVHN